MSETAERIKREWLATHAKTGFEDLYEAEWGRMIAQVRAEAVEHVEQIADNTLRMCQRGGVGEGSILPPEKEAGFQLCIDNIANLAKSMKEELK